MDCAYSCRVFSSFSHSVVWSWSKRARAIRIAFHHFRCKFWFYYVIRYWSVGNSVDCASAAGRFRYLKIEYSDARRKETISRLAEDSLAFLSFLKRLFTYLYGLAPAQELAEHQRMSSQLMLVGQLILGGLMVMFMDEVTTKWGFGSGISLFIAAGVSSSIFIRAFSPLSSAGTWALGSSEAPVGQIWVFLFR